MRVTRWWHAILALVGTAACASPPAGPTPVQGPPALEHLAPGTLLRLSQGGTRSVGFLASVDADSIRLEQDGRRWAVARTSADTVWIRSRRSHSTARTGLVLGVVVGGIAFFSMRQDPEARGFAAPAGLGITGGLVGIGVFADALQSDPWQQVAPPPAVAPSSP